ncbi:MAG: hypothetical protein ACLP5E_02135 [Streptosporangiaceae bacterium]
MWHLAAAGHCDDPAREHDLAEKLARLLGEKWFGTTTSHLGGEVVNGPVHVPAPEEPAAETVADAITE